MVDEIHNYLVLNRKKSPNMTERCFLPKDRINSPADLSLSQRVFCVRLTGLTPKAGLNCGPTGRTDRKFDKRCVLDLSKKAYSPIGSARYAHRLRKMLDPMACFSGMAAMQVNSFISDCIKRQKPKL